MVNITLLRTELDTDPLGRGYSGMNDIAAAASLNAVNRTYKKNTLSGSQMYELVDDTEFYSLTTAQQQRVRDVINLDTIQVQSGRARATITALFTANTITRENLLDAVSIPCSRAREIGAVGDNEVVTYVHVNQARAL